MERRYFLQAVLGPVFLTTGLVEGSRQAEVQPKAKYILFADPDAIDGSFTLPDDIDLTLVMVKPRGDQSMDDCIRLYQLGSEKPCDEGDG
jgi:hypothetical protein